jgi:hypothetical protein
MNIVSPKSARTLALSGDHSNYTFEQAGYNTAGRALEKCAITDNAIFQCSVLYSFFFKFDMKLTSKLM